MEIEESAKPLADKWTARSLAVVRARALAHAYASSTPDEKRKEARRRRGRRPVFARRAPQTTSSWPRTNRCGVSRCDPGGGRE